MLEHSTPNAKEPQTTGTQQKQSGTATSRRTECCCWNTGAAEWHGNLPASPDQHISAMIRCNCLTCWHTKNDSRWQPAAHSHDQLEPSQPLTQHTIAVAYHHQQTGGHLPRTAGSPHNFLRIRLPTQTVEWHSHGTPTQQCMLIAQLERLEGRIPGWHTHLCRTSHHQESSGWHTKTYCIHPPPAADQTTTADGWIWSTQHLDYCHPSAWPELKHYKSSWSTAHCHQAGTEHSKPNAKEPRNRQTHQPARCSSATTCYCYLLPRLQKQHKADGWTWPATNLDLHRLHILLATAEWHSSTRPKPAHPPIQMDTNQPANPSISTAQGYQSCTANTVLEHSNLNRHNHQSGTATLTLDYHCYFFCTGFGRTAYMLPAPNDQYTTAEPHIAAVQNCCHYLPWLNPQLQLKLTGGQTSKGVVRLSTACTNRMAQPHPRPNLLHRTWEKTSNSPGAYHICQPQHRCTEPPIMLPGVLSMLDATCLHHGQTHMLTRRHHTPIRIKKCIMLGYPWSYLLSFCICTNSCSNYYGCCLKICLSGVHFLMEQLSLLHYLLCCSYRSFCNTANTAEQISLGKVVRGLPSPHNVIQQHVAVSS